MPQMRFIENASYYDKEKEELLKNTIRGICDKLEINIKNKHTLIEIIRNENRELKSEEMVTPQKPEDFTKELIFEPLLKALGYKSKDIKKETRQDLDIDKRWSDYRLEIGQDFVLVETEPINKNLYGKNCGINQIRQVLASKQTPTDFGIATDGIIWIMLKFDWNSHQNRILKRIDLRPVFLDASGQKIIDEEIDIPKRLEDFYNSFSIKSIIKSFKEEFNNLEIARESISEKFYSDYIKYVFGVDVKNGEKKYHCLIDEIIPAPSSKIGDKKLFAINFMNRILFIKFLEDKGLIEENLLYNLWREFSKIESIPGRFYDIYLKPLFFGVFNTPVEKRDKSVKTIHHFHGIPYLNGGLFRECIENEMTYSIENDILEIILKEFLSGYKFTISGQEGLDPDILGNIFEKTINYNIASTEMDNQWLLGAYYTPDEITTYIVKNSLHPLLLENIKKAYLADGWPEVELRHYDSLDSFLKKLPHNTQDIERL